MLCAAAPASNRRGQKKGPAHARARPALQIDQPGPDVRVGRPEGELSAVYRLRAVVAYSLCSRKEVIQPQVPLRLPCYDFAPVTELAFGRSLPCGLGHGLRALPAPMA